MSLDVYLIAPEYNIRIFEQNITHQMTEMAKAAALYTCLWYPETLCITAASQLIKPLSGGLNSLKSSPDFFKKFNPKNNYGSYESLVEFVSNYLDACIRYPQSRVEISR